MRITVIGAGGTGGYFGGLLARAGEQVTFLARGTQLEALRTHGLTVKSRLAGTFSVPVRATNDPEEIGPVDLVLFCVKVYDTVAASQGLHHVIGPETVVLPVQNGIDADERLSGEAGMQHLILRLQWRDRPHASAHRAGGGVSRNARVPPGHQEKKPSPAIMEGFISPQITRRKKGGTAMTAMPEAQTKAAPGQLALIQALVNTQYGQARRAHREVTTPEQLRAFLVENHLFADGLPVTEGDFRRLIQMREALRSLLRRNTDGEDTPLQVELLNTLASNAPLTVRFQRDGLPVLEPDIAGVDGVIASLLGMVFTSMIDGTWRRLKVCRNERCQKAFYDTSKNGSGVWCSMAGCGSRVKARAYRQRHIRQTKGASSA
jgi:hypothetical protein